MKIPVHQATTAQLGAAYPFVNDARLPVDRVLIGRDRNFRTYAYDPFDLYRYGAITNPNMVILGQVGRGKSALVKSFLYREFAFGRRLIVIDPKGEYGPFARATGGVVIELSPGGSLSLDPFHHYRSDRDNAASSPQSVLEGLCAASLGRRLRADEVVTLQVALQSVRSNGTRLSLRSIARALFDPDAEVARAIGVSTQLLVARGEMPRFGLLRLLGGEFGEMFAEGRTREIDLRAPVVVVDISSFYRSEALSVALMSIFGALESVIVTSETPTIFVLDEAWAVLSNDYVGQLLQSFFKLARSYGLSNVLVAHRPSDLLSDGGRVLGPVGAGEGLLGDCETVVCYALNPKEAESAGRLFGYSTRLQELLCRLGRGAALWSVGHHLSLVEHHMSATELELVDTDRRMLL